MRTKYGVLSQQNPNKPMMKKAHVRKNPQRKTLLALLKTAKKQAAATQKSLKVAKRNNRQTKQQLKVAKREAKKARKFVKILKAESVALIATKPAPRRVDSKLAAKRIRPVTKTVVKSTVIPVVATPTTPTTPTSPVKRLLEVAEVPANGLSLQAQPGLDLP